MFDKNLFSTEKTIFGINDYKICTIQLGENIHPLEFTTPKIETDTNNIAVNYEPDIKVIKKNNTPLLQKMGLKLFVKKKGRKREDLKITRMNTDKGYKEVKTFVNKESLHLDLANRRIRLVGPTIKTPWFVVGEVKKTRKREVLLS